MTITFLVSVTLHYYLILNPLFLRLLWMTRNTNWWTFIPLIRYLKRELRCVQFVVELMLAVYERAQLSFPHGRIAWIVMMTLFLNGIWTGTHFLKNNDLVLDIDFRITLMKDVTIMTCPLFHF